MHDDMRTFIAGKDPLLEKIVHILHPEQETIDNPNNPYANAINIISVSDGIAKDPTNSIAAALRNIYPKKNIARTELSFDTQNLIPGIEHYEIDNNKPFAKIFDEKKYDVIVARDALCHCCTKDFNKSCAGIANDVESKQSFLTELLKIFNFDLPHSFIFLSNSSSSALGKQTPNQWAQAIKKISTNNSHIKFQLIYKIKDPAGSNLENAQNQVKFSTMKDSFIKSQRRTEYQIEPQLEFLGVYITPKIF